MNEQNLEVELLSEGLKSYPSAKRALETFENLVGEIAKKIILSNTDRFRAVIGKEDFTEYDLKLSALNPTPSKVESGVVLYPPEIWEMRFGIKWSKEKTLGPEVPQAFISIQISNKSQHEALFRNLRNNASETDLEAVKIQKIQDRSYEVHISCPLTDQRTATAQFEEKLRKVFTAFMGMTERSGGLQAAILGESEQT